MNLGTICMMPLAAAKCSAPKTANGRAKQRLARATILSRPPARTTSFFVASAAITKRTTAAEQVETTVRETSKKISPGRVLRMLVYIFDEARPGSESFDWTARRWQSGELGLALM